MIVEYSNRALADLRKISTDSRRQFGDGTAAKLEAYIRTLVEHIRAGRRDGLEIAQLPGVHVVPLVQYPYKVFYRVLKDRVRIQHIRHTSRQSWEGQ